MAWLTVNNGDLRRLTGASAPQAPLDPLPHWAPQSRIEIIFHSRHWRAKTGAHASLHGRIDGQ
jgi:hypothetical protein